jgi:putative ABC transport system permease protein
MRFSFRAAAGSPARTLLSLLAMAIGVGVVILLTALAEGAPRYVTRKFTCLGTHLLIAIPYRSETTGEPPPLLGETPRDLTIEDALALKRSSAMRRIAPVALGSAPVTLRQRACETTVLGSSVELFDLWQLSMAQGRFLPPGNPSRGSAVCVLGYKTKRELFDNVSPLERYQSVFRNIQEIRLWPKKVQKQPPGGKDQLERQ